MKLFRFVFVLLLSFSSAAFAQQNVLILKSQPGDPVGGGVTRLFTQAGATFSGGSTPPSGVLLFVQETNPFGMSWTLVFGAPFNQPLQPGTYMNAQHSPVQPLEAPDLYVAHSALCNSISGTFTVREISQGMFGELLTLAVDFEQYCDGASQPLIGELRFNSSVPTSIPLPPIISLEDPLNLGNCVEATGPKGATVKLNATASRDALGGTNLDFTWSTSAGKTGSGVNFSFDAGLGGMPTLVELSMLDRTNGQRQTASKPVCVSDTTPPTIEILSPKQGEVLRGAGPVRLDVRITDAVDKNIKKFNASFGTQGNYSIGPSGRERVQLVRPDSGEQIQMNINVQAVDASGNFGFGSVSFTRAKRAPGGQTP